MFCGSFGASVSRDGCGSRLAGTAFMKTLILFLCGAVLSAGAVCAKPPHSTNDAVAIAAAAAPPGARIVPTASGYRIEGPGVRRVVYRTATGYRIEGGGGQPELRLTRTATGWRVEDEAIRAGAIRAQQKKGHTGCVSKNRLMYDETRATESSKSGVYFRAPR
jgi:hypothetical protein